MRVCYVLLTVVAALVADTCATVSAASDSSIIKLSEEISPNSAQSSHSLTTHDSNFIGRRSLRGVKEDKDDTSTKISATEDDKDEEERVVLKADLVASLRISEGDAKVLRGILKRREPEHILAKLKAPFEYVNGFKVYPKDSPQYRKYLYYVKYARDYLPDSMFAKV
ncbi:hypothetical protein PHYBOEH_001562 [Phytophthora boehmeriae]|uniref:RxLR effector protein n=1 Tax=Phytophthora boehmeriae TaxID=109152 RepID=A0A8T1WXH7_9STRA|nr:hypothetical protein PHYBOEH_001562 [Phytophthora boehmeriae]